MNARANSVRSAHVSSGASLYCACLLVMHTREPLLHTHRRPAALAEWPPLNTGEGEFALRE